MQHITPANQLAEQTLTSKIVSLWLHGKAEKTQKAYLKDVSQFFSHVNKPIELVTLEDFHNFIDSLQDLATSTQGRKINAVKSMLSFASKQGLLKVNIGVAVKPPKLENTLAERILPEVEVIRLIDKEKNPQRHLILYLAYSTGIRNAEIAGLCWRHLTANGETGQLAIHGKGSRTRFLKLTPKLWDLLQAHKKQSDRTEPSDPIFLSQKGSHFSGTSIWRIVNGAGENAELDKSISPHWLRHAHASHSLDRGCPIHLLQAQLGHASLATTSKYTHAKPNDTSSRFLVI
jgi:integrase/recombinase XerD